MERMTQEDLQVLSASSIEHIHRYLCAAALARGSVLDLACGIGYGAKILLKNPAVTDYVGVDVAEDAIAEAQRLALNGARFITGSALDLPFEDAAFDTIVSMETLEHLENPARALAEFRRVLKPGGRLVGSVPSASFEDFCTTQYGKNQYHLQKFSAPQLKDLLAAAFRHSQLFLARVGIGAALYDENGQNGPFHHAVLAEPSSSGQDYGSYLFVAAHDPLPQDLAQRLGVVLIGGSYFLAESLQVDHRLAAGLAEGFYAELIRSKDELIKSKDEQLRQAEALVQERDRQLHQAEALVQERGRQLRQAESLIQAKDEHIQHAEEEKARLRAALDTAQMELMQIESSRAWQLLSRLRGLRRLAGR